MIPKTSPPRPLYLPSLKGKMGNWVYYATSMRFGDLAERVGFATEMRNATRYDDWLQRDLREERTKKIADYIIDRKERFFSSLVVTVYSGQPKWLDLAIGDSNNFSVDEVPGLHLKTINEALGILVFTGEEDLFAVDGQHRLSGIREAVTRQPERADEMISVLFVADRGTIETRRLFSTLNRYAAPVTQGEKIILDEDDALAIVTRKLISKHPLLSCKNSVAAPKRLSLNWDDPNFTTALTLYKVSEILCIDIMRGRKDQENENWTREILITSERPSDVIIDKVYEVSSIFWSKLAEKFKEIGEIQTISSSAAMSKYRLDSGGHLLLRPVGQMAFARAVRSVIDQMPTSDYSHNIPLAIDMLSKAQPEQFFMTDYLIWNNLLWNPVNKSMINGVAQQKLSARLMCLYSGFKETKNTSKEDILTTYQKITGSETVKLPSLSVNT